MPGATTNLQLPYPLGTDPVQDGDDRMKALAEMLDKGMIPFKMAAGSKVFSISAAASAAAQTVAFAAGRFTFPPLIFFGVQNNPAGSLKAVPRITTAPTATGFGFAVYSSDGSNVTFSALQVNWYAIQMLPTGSAGGE